jgi:hypothetical protein
VGLLRAIWRLLQREVWWSLFTSSYRAMGWGHYPEPAPALDAAMAESVARGAAWLTAPGRPLWYLWPLATIWRYFAKAVARAAWAVEPRPVRQPSRVARRRASRASQRRAR